MFEGDRTIEKKERSSHGTPGRSGVPGRRGRLRYQMRRSGQVLLRRGQWSKDWKLAKQMSQRRIF